jgi:uncharacterized integral membrane protein (TIGR00698 family)
MTDPQPQAPVLAPTPDQRPARYWNFVGGVLFTALIAGAGTALAEIPGLNHIGPLACSIVLAVLYRQFFGYPLSIRSGIQFSAKRLLRVAIILYGLRLNIDVIFHKGLPLLGRDVFTIAFSIAVMFLFAKIFKAERGISLLLGIGTGVCGAAAIAAVSPILRSDEEDTAVSVGIIALIGTVFAVGYTLLRTILPLTALQYGIWSGISIHEVAQVALAAAPAGVQSLDIALLAKLGRVFLLVPLSFILMIWMKRKGKYDGKSKIEFPWFLLGFIAMSLFGSYILGKSVIVPAATMNAVFTVSAFILTTAMVGLGLNVHLSHLKTKAARPLVAMVSTSILLSAVSLLSLKLLP